MYGKLVKSCLSLSNTFKKFFINLSLICNGGNRIYNMPGLISDCDLILYVQYYTYIYNIFMIH